MKLIELINLIDPNRTSDEYLVLMEDDDNSFMGATKSKYWDLFADYEVENIGAEGKDRISVWLKE